MTPPLPPNKISGRSGGVTIGDVQGGIVNSIIAGGDIIQKIFIGDDSERNLRNKMFLLQKVRTFWIDGVLEMSVHRELLIELGKQDQSAAVDFPWDAVLATADEETRSLTRTDGILRIFEAQGQALLILGEPGSGKTITLLELARESTALAMQDPTRPVPVVLNLSSWAERKYPLDRWLVEELNAKYQIPRKVGRRWVEGNDLLLLLDGLDEVQVDQRDACTEAINKFRQDNGLIPIAICSRVGEYKALRSRLKLQGAILLQPLTATQIEEYFARAGPALSNIRTLVDQDETLKELAQSPLMLSVISLAFDSSTVADLGRQADEPAKSAVDRLFAAYVARMFRHRKTRGRYSTGTIANVLVWLAQRMGQYSQSVFLIEGLQPNWLSSGAQRWAYILAARTAAAFAIWLAFCPLLAMARPAFDTEVHLLFGTWLPFCGAGLVIGAVDGWRLRRARATDAFPDRTARLARRTIGVLITSLLAFVGIAIGIVGTAFVPSGSSALLLAGMYLWAIDGILIIPLFAAVAVAPFGLILGLRRHLVRAGQDIEPVESIGLSWRRFLNVFGLAAMVAIGTWLWTSSIRNPAANVWDTTGTYLVGLDLPKRSFSEVMFSPDGGHIAGVDDENNVRVFDAGDGTDVLTIALCATGPRVQFSPDGKRVAVTTTDSGQVWDVAKGKRLIAVVGSNAFVNRGVTQIFGHAAMGNADKDVVCLYAFANPDSDDQLWDVATGNALATIPIEGLVHPPLTFNRDGLRLLAISKREIQLWNAREGKFLAVLGNVTVRAPLAKFSPDGAQALAAGDDSIARLWNASDGASIARSRVNWRVLRARHSSRSAPTGHAW
jgi:hypothetical protein